VAAGEQCTIHSCVGTLQMDPHIIHGFLNPRVSPPPQMASQSVQPFLHTSIANAASVHLMQAMLPNNAVNLVNVLDD